MSSFTPNRAEIVCVGASEADHLIVVVPAAGSGTAGPATATSASTRTAAATTCAA
jgi:hypothetical protein